MTTGLLGLGVGSVMCFPPPSFPAAAAAAGVSVMLLVFATRFTNAVDCGGAGAGSSNFGCFVFGVHTEEGVGDGSGLVDFFLLLVVMMVIVVVVIVVVVVVVDDDDAVVVPVLVPVLALLLGALSLSLPEAVWSFQC